MENLAAASREELLAVIASLAGEVEALRARVAQLEAENLRLRRGGEGGVELWPKPSQPATEKKERKRRGQAFVRRRETPDEVRYHGVERCPDCGRKLAGGWEHRRHQVMEVVLPPVRVIDHVVVGRWCGGCRKRWLPTLEAAEIGVQGKRRFGVSVQGLVAVLHIACRIPMKMVRRLLWEAWGLKMSAGEVVELLEGTAGAGQAAVRELLEAVRGSPVVCADETGWREDGRNGYLWTFSTATVRYFVYDQSRSGAVPREVLGEEFGGVTVSDFYSGYNRLEGKHQRCWVHLIRDLKALAELNGDRPDTLGWGEAVLRLYAQARAFGDPRSRRRAQAQRAFQRELAELAHPWVDDDSAPQRVLAQRIIKHLSELFLFVGDPRVPADNNLAERSLRPAVVARKISGGTRSPKGSHTKMALMSLLATWQAQGKPLLSSCQQLLLSRPSP